MSLLACVLNHVLDKVTKHSSWQVDGILVSGMAA
jgi:hypothetical protein